MNPHARHSYINDRFYDRSDSWTQRESRSRDGVHAGKGPKFYRRSDERILEEANEALTQDAFVDASEILVKVEKSILTLSGTVTDRRAKKAAERSVESIFGISDIKNLIEIISAENQQ